MPAEQLLPSADRFISNENIAIAVLSVVVLGLVCAVIAQWKRNREIENARVQQEVACNERMAALIKNNQDQLEKVINNFRSDMKEAWGYVSQNIEPVRELATEIRVLGAAAAAAAASRPRSG
jgi:septal ring factor EnvC (AmiA/AmiB activator)